MKTGTTAGRDRHPTRDRSSERTRTTGTGHGPAYTHAYAKLPAQDVERARAFYAGKLGLRPFGEVYGNLLYQVAGVPFIVFPSAGAPSGTHDQLGFVVDDLEAEVGRLRSAGPRQGRVARRPLDARRVAPVARRRWRCLLGLQAGDQVAVAHRSWATASSSTR